MFFVNKELWIKELKIENLKRKKENKIKVKRKIVIYKDCLGIVLFRKINEICFKRFLRNIVGEC